MRKTKNSKKAISIRITEKDYAYAEQLLPHLPLADTVSGVGYNAFVIGLYVLLADHTEIIQAGEKRYTEQLIQLLRPALSYLKGQQSPAPPEAENKALGSRVIDSNELWHMDWFEEI